MFKFFRPIFLSVFSFLSFSSLFSQSKKDTIYFDEDWSICEKPVADYYRVCTLNKQNVIYYKGDVQDYYISGQLEMSGYYTDSGYREGKFVFYNTNGLMLKEESYKDDEPYGDWMYYDSAGKLRTELICKSSDDFTPIFLVTDTNDTLIKNGNGEFTFDAQKDFKHVFPVAEEYFVKGEVNDSLKNGVFNYYISQNEKNASFSETYKNGNFIKGKSYNTTVKVPLRLLHLKDFNLDKLNGFYHSNPVFDFGTNKEQKVIDFLLNNKSPKIEYTSPDFYSNDRILFYIITKVLKPDLQIDNFTNFVNFPQSSAIENYYYFLIPKNNNKVIHEIKGNVVLTIDTTGQIINSVFDSSVTKTEISKINYYLDHLKGLMPYQFNNQKSIANINLKLNTIIDTPEDNNINIRYMIYNSDSIELSKNLVQTEAKFPSGNDAWMKYLERNLNAAVPAENHAPNGNYTVTVSFMVDTEGNISDIRAENDPGFGTAQEAIRVIKKGPKWIPAIKNGKNVSYRQKQNITFQVSGQ